MKNKVVKVKNEVVVSAIQCPRCGDIIYSRAHHDMRWCGCGAVAIDGGFDYMKVSAETELAEQVETIPIKLPLTVQELYDDWRYHTDKFGKVER
jgi:ribosomal protein S27AE